MTEILLVTGNQNKLNEWQHLMPEGVTLQAEDIDLPEIQSDDPLEIADDKARRAFEVVGKPVVIEDVAAGLEKLHGLPGPFIKFFLKRLGQDALYQLAGNQDGEAATAICTAAYYDGSEAGPIKVQGVVNGTLVKQRVESPFGFDINFMPEGHDVTYAEMTPEFKATVSHRSLAAKLLIEELRKQGILKG